MQKVKTVLGICGGCRKLRKLISKGLPPVMCRRCRSLMMLSDLAFTKHVSRIFDEHLIVPRKGTWKSMADRSAARLELLGALSRLAQKRQIECQGK